MATKRDAAASAAERSAGDRRCGLTLEELALVADGLAESLSDDGARRLGQVIRTDPRFETDLAELEQLAREAGLQPGDSFEYLSAAQAGDEALTTLLHADGWNHPAEILDPDGSRGIPYPLLIRLARERAGKGEHAARILDVRQRLEEAQAAELAVEALVDRFVAGLFELPEDEASALLRRVERQHLEDRKRAAENERRKAPGDGTC